MFTLPGKAILSPPKPKSPPPPAPVPTGDDPAVQDARRKEREAAQRRKGRASTILTNPLGDTSSAQTKVTKLGGG